MRIYFDLYFNFFFLKREEDKMLFYILEGQKIN